MPRKLSDTQLVLITNAAQRPSLRLLPAPKSLTKNAGTIAVSIKSMLAAGLIDKVPAESGDIIWPADESEAPTTLVVTGAGLVAVGIESAPQVVEKREPKVSDATSQTSPTPRTGTKLSILTEKLRSRDGATLSEIAKVTGWQHHSIRGAISGALKKKLGLEVASEVIDGRGRVYRIAIPEKPTSAKPKRASTKVAKTESAVS